MQEAIRQNRPVPRALATEDVRAASGQNVALPTEKAWASRTEKGRAPQPGTREPFFLREKKGREVPDEGDEFSAIIAHASPLGGFSRFLENRRTRPACEDPHSAPQRNVLAW